MARVLLLETIPKEPRRAWGYRYDGTIDVGNELVTLVRNARNGQRLYFEGEDGRLVLHGPEGTSDLFENWFLIKRDDGLFEILTPQEVEKKYRARSKKKG
jgi:hypothetical protein